MSLGEMIDYCLDVASKNIGSDNRETREIGERNLRLYLWLTELKSYRDKYGESKNDDESFTTYLNLLNN